VPGRAHLSIREYWADFLTQNAGLMSSAPALRFREAQVLANLRKPLETDKSKDILFGKTQYAKK
jgi:hypothetical protein